MIWSLPFPRLLLAIMITAVFGPGAVNAIIAIGIFNIPVFARLARGAALSLWTRDYILAARVAGKGRARISAEHILPNIANLLIVQGTIQFSLAILAEAALAYVGLGAQPPLPSWGRMLADAQTLISLGAAHGLVSRLCNHHHRAWSQPDGRRAARSVRSETQAGAGMSALSISNLRVDIHGKTVLHDIDLELEPGKILGVVGESGSGKSMTALSVMQLLPRGSRWSGRLEVAGSDLATMDEPALCQMRGRDVGMIFQEPMTALNPVRTIGDQVAETVMVHTAASRRERSPLPGPCSTGSVCRKTGFRLTAFPMISPAASGSAWSSPRRSR
jgi:ABC-type multidrug transport system fused ATPase/permease subunit